MTDKKGNTTDFSLEELTRLVAGEVAKKIASCEVVDLHPKPGLNSGYSVLWIFGAPAAHIDKIELLWTRINSMGYLQRFVLCEEASWLSREKLSFVPPDCVVIIRDGERADTGKALSSSLKWCSDTSVTYVASLKTSSAKKIVDLDDSDVFSMLVIEGLLASTPVHVLRGKELGGLHRVDPTGDSSRVPGNLFRRLSSLWRDLEMIGVRPMNPEDGLKPIASFQSAKSPMIKSMCGLVTEKDVEEAAEAGLPVITLGPGTVVTPLAKDRANELRIKLSR